MKKGSLKKFFAVTCILLVILSIVCSITAWAGFKFFGDQLCSTTVQKVIESPDGSKKAAYYLTDCGATTPYVPHISILDYKKEIGGNGNVLKALRVNGKFDIEWESNDLLIVYYENLEEVQKQKDEYEGIEIQYVQKDITVDSEY